MKKEPRHLTKAHALANAAVGLLLGLTRVAQTRPLVCGVCDNSVRTLANWQAALQIGRASIPCRRVLWSRLARCTGELRRSADVAG
jgi:hypothetical protein